MTLTHPYCTVQQVRDQLSDKDAKVSDDMIERAISAASRAVDKWCGRRFWRDEVLTVRSYRPASWYKAAVGDIASLEDLEVATRTGRGGAWSPWAIDVDFELGPDDADADGGAYAWWKITVVGERRLPVAAWRSLRVTALHGWSEVPDEVIAATLLRAVALFKRKDSPSGVAGFGDFGAVRITRSDPDVIALLLPFQRTMVA